MSDSAGRQCGRAVAFTYWQAGRADRDGCRRFARQNGKNMEPLFWLVEYTGCMSVWQTRVVAPTVPTEQQQAALEELYDAAFLAPKYLMQTPGQEYVESVHQAKEELGDR